MDQSFKLTGQSTVVAGEDLTGKCERAVKLTANGVVVCDTIGEEVFGILRTPGLAGENVLVDRTGKDKPCIFGATVVKYAPLMTDAEGRLITRVTGAGNALAGYAGSAGAVDEHHTIIIKTQAVLD